MAPGVDHAFEALCKRLCPSFRANAERIVARKSQLLAGEVDGVPVIAKRLAKSDDVWSWYLARELAIYRDHAARVDARHEGRRHEVGRHEVARHAVARHEVARHEVARHEVGRHEVARHEVTRHEVDARDPGIAALPMPRLVALDEATGVLIIERARGEQLARRRDPMATLTPSAIDALLDARRQVARCSGTWPSVPPTARVRSQLRARFLEDPSAPIEWVRDGLLRCARRQLIERRVANAAVEAIDAFAVVAPSHGDLLLRNAFGERRQGDQWDITFVDWECAGPHLLDWDLALLWTQLSAQSRVRIDAEVRSTTDVAIRDDAARDVDRSVDRLDRGEARQRCFMGLVAFALAREISFLLAFRTRADHGGLGRRRDELVVVGNRLVG